MATTEKAKKAAKPKKGSKGKKKTKKNSSMNFFSKIMMALLFISIITIAVFLIAGNFKKDDDGKPKTELSLESKKKSKVEKESKTETKGEGKEETSVKETQKETEEKETKKETLKEEPKKETAKTETTKTETEVKKQETKTQKSESKSKSKTLSGSWLSSEQGASLTLDEYGYRIDFFGVDASKPMTGNYTIEKNLIVFTSDDKDCKGSGTYRITFYKENFSLIAKDDECTQRRNILEADWEWIEI